MEQKLEYSTIKEMQAMPGLSERYEDQLDAIEWGKREAKRLEAAKVTAKDAGQAVWKAVEEKIATGESSAKEEE